MVRKCRLTHIVAVQERLPATIGLSVCEQLGNSAPDCLRAQKIHVGLHVRCPLLLSNFDENVNVGAGFSITHRYKISRECVQP